MQNIKKIHGVSLLEVICILFMLSFALLGYSKFITQRYQDLHWLNVELNKHQQWVNEYETTNWNITH